MEREEQLRLRLPLGRSAACGFSPISSSIENSIASARQDARSAESEPEIHAGYFPHHTETETKYEGKPLRRCSVLLPWSFRQRPEVERKNNQKAYPENNCFCNIWHVR